MKATSWKRTRMVDVLRLALEAQTTRKSLSVAAPNEWAVYQAGEEALKLAAPEEWKAYRATLW